MSDPATPVLPARLVTWLLENLTKEPVGSRIELSRLLATYIEDPDLSKWLLKQAKILEDVEKSFSEFQLELELFNKRTL